MDFFGPIFWHQGLFLQPHHFQLFDRSVQMLFGPFHDYLAPHFWGVGGMEIQEASLGTGSFQLAKGDFLFPDGTYAAFPGNALVEPRQFDDAWVAGGKPFTIYLGLRKWNNLGENVTVVESLEDVSKVTTRFAAPADAEEWQDIHAGGPPAQVKRLHYVLRVCWETEQDLLGDYLLIPVAQLERQGEEIVLSPSFVPPPLTIASSESLLKIIKEVRDQIASKSRQLEEYKRQRGIQTATFGSRDMVYLLALRSLNRYVPILCHLIETRQVQPWGVFGILRQLIGELSSFSEKVNVLGEPVGDGETDPLPVYDHRNPWECFAAAQLLIGRLLDEITAGPDYVIPLIYDGTYFTAEMKPVHFENRNRYYLVLRTEEEPGSIIRSVDRVAKLGSRERLPLLIARALPGVGLEHLPTPPQELPRRSYSIHFAVDSNCEQWALIKKGNNIALYWDNAPEDLEVELMLVGR
ncbi:MAG TPA: type VI secretion system baseplate subunit TssK [Geobacteraceae bacterium]